MFIMPTGQIIQDGIMTNRIDIPSMFNSIRAEKFTGILHFGFSVSSGYVFFFNGAVNNALYSENNIEQAGADGLMSIIKTSLNQVGTVSKSVVDVSVLRFLVSLPSSKVLQRNALVTGFDFKSFLQNVAISSQSVAMIIYVNQVKTSMILYEMGQSLGFFHNGFTTITKDNLQSKTIGQDPNARLTICICQFQQGVSSEDILSYVNIEKVCSQIASGQQISVNIPKFPSVADDKYSQKLDLMKKAAQEHLGPIGKAILDREVAKRGGLTKIIESNLTTEMISSFEKQALQLEKESLVTKAVTAIKALI